MFAAWIEPVRLRQREQWQYWKKAYGGLTSKATAPQTQLPVGMRVWSRKTSAASMGYDRSVSDELLDRIACDPDNELEHLRVYADQLLLAGDPRGELINVAIQRQTKNTIELGRREDTLIADQRARLDGLLGALGPAYTWNRGFLDTIAF